MIAVQYKRDLKNSYLILPVDTEAVRSYQMQMISRNKIDGLLSCQLKTEENQKVCWYEISSKQSLQHIFAASEINYEELKNLLTGIYMILQKLDKYLLHNACLLLEPEYIYMDIEKKKIYLVYLPGYEENSFTGIRHLAEYVISRVNHTDEAAVKLAYYFYQCAREENFSFQYMTEYIEKQNTQVDMSEQTEEKWLYEQKMTAAINENTDKADTAIEISEEAVCETEETERKASGKVMQNRILFAGMTGTIIIVSISIYLLMNYYLRIQEKAVMAGMIAVFYTIIAILYIHYGRSNKGGCQETGEEKETLLYHMDYQDREREETYGNTVFFGNETALLTHYLDGEYKGNKIYYEVEKDRVTIGKLKDKADILLQDTSVSRLHAQIYQKGEKMLLKDLNSTNGTYKNGVLLQPEEVVELKPLDELRFGRICLTYH